MVRNGAQQAVLRAKAEREGRSLLIETELNLTGRDKVRLNRQPVRRNDELFGAVLVTIFSPDDIEMVKGGPQLRRQYLDDLLGALQPKHNAACSELERILKQRNALLRSAGGVLRGSMASTLDIWDEKLASVGEAIADAREALIGTLEKATDDAYLQLSRHQKTRQRAGGGFGLRTQLARPSPVSAERGQGGRRPARRDERGAAARRALHVGQGAGGPYASVAGGATEPGPLTSVGRPCAGQRPARLEPGIAARRRVLRARPRPQRGTGVVLAGRAGAADDRRPGPAGIAGDALGSRSRRGCRTGWSLSVMAPTGERKDDPRRISASLPEAARLIGAPGAMELAAVQRAWADVVGEQAAAHLRPQAFTGGVLTVAADHHAWATELRLLASDLLKRLQVPCPSVRSIVVVVSPGQGLNW